MTCRAFLIVSLFSVSIGHAQQSIVDSLKRILPVTPDEKKIEVYQGLITKLWLNQPDTAMYYAQQAIEFAKSRDAHDKAVAMRLKGAVFFYLDQYDSSIKYNHRALLLSEEAKDSLLVANSMNNVGLAFFKVGSYPQALEYLLKSLRLKYQIKKNNALGRTLNNVGLVYNELKQYDKAREYFNKAADVTSELKDKDGWIYSLNNLGQTYLNGKRPKEAEAYYKKARELGLTTDNAVDESTTFCGLGRVAIELGDLRQAKIYLNESLRIRQSINEAGGMAEVYLYYSDIYKKSGSIDSALYFLKTSLKLANQVHSRDIGILCYKSLTALYTQKKKYDSAFFYQSKFLAQRDSLFDENLARNISNIQLQIQDEEASAKLMEKDKEINLRTTQAYFLAAIVLLVMIFAIGFYLSLNRLRRLKDQLTQKNNEIEQQKEELQVSNEQLANAHELISKQNSELEEYNLQLQSTVNTRTKELELANKELTVVNLELDNFIYKSSHDIKGPLARLIGLCHVALLDVSDQKARQYLSKLSENAKNLSEIFDRLRTVSDIDSIELTHEKIQFNEMIERIKNRLKTLDGYNEITFKEEIENIDFQSDPVLLETIFHNLIENAVKFQKKSSQFNKFISIKVKKQNEDVYVSFVDNGIGIRKTDDNELFTMFTNAALEHKTIGLGLYIVKQCAAKLNGSVRIVPNTNQYTEFELTLPLESYN